MLKDMIYKFHSKLTSFLPIIIKTCNQIAILDPKISKYMCIHGQFNDYNYYYIYMFYWRSWVNSFICVVLEVGGGGRGWGEGGEGGGREGGEGGERGVGECNVLADLMYVTKCRNAQLHYCKVRGEEVEQLIPQSTTPLE